MSLDLATIGIEDAIAEVDIGPRRPLDHKDLVGADAEAAVRDSAPLFRCKADSLVDCIDHHEIISSAVHFCKFEFHAK